MLKFIETLIVVRKITAFYRNGQRPTTVFSKNSEKQPPETSLWRLNYYDINNQKPMKQTILFFTFSMPFTRLI
jgi:hypothetical protein